MTAEFYRAMRRIRTVEEQMMTLKTAGDVPGSIHLCNGQEAIPVGACAALRDDDWVSATYRGHGWAIARGVDLAQLFAEVMGRDSALCGGRAGSPYFSDPSHHFLGENSIVGAGVPIACGAALSAQRAGNGAVSVVSIGDGATNQGAVHEALNLAAVLRLPLIVMIENNIYSEMSPIADMVRIDRLAERGVGYGIPATTIDGNDAEAVRASTTEAVGRARAGEGPTIIEAMTERLVGHYSGDVQQYRPKGDVARATQTEPLVRLRADLRPDRLAELDRIDGEVAAEVAAAIASARTVDYPAPDTAKEHVYV